MAFSLLPLVWLLLGCFFSVSAHGNAAAGSEPETLVRIREHMTDLRLPEHFSIDVYAFDEDLIDDPRGLKHVEYDDSIIVYVGSKIEEPPSLLALVDYNRDGVNDYIVPIMGAGLIEELSPQNESTHTAYISIDTVSELETIYIATELGVYVCSDTHSFVMDLVRKEHAFDYDALLSNDIFLSQEHCELFMDIPDTSDGSNYGHTRHFSQISPDNQELCIAFGNPCDTCPVIREFDAQIRCYPLHNQNTLPLDITDDVSRILANGVRNSVGFDWYPETNQLWFSDNAANDVDGPGFPTPLQYPDDELNVIEERGQHFGHPMCHSIGTGDPNHRTLNHVLPHTLPANRNDTNCSDFDANKLAMHALSPHSAVLGMRYYNHSLLVALHGSSDSRPVCYGAKIVRVFIAYEYDWDDGVSRNRIESVEDFLHGWQNTSNGTECDWTTNVRWGRPVDIEVLSSDGSILVSDDYAHVIYRITYDAETEDNGKKKNKSGTRRMWTILLYCGIGLGCAALLVIILVAVFWYKNHERKKKLVFVNKEKNVVKYASFDMVETQQQANAYKEKPRINKYAAET